MVYAQLLLEASRHRSVPAELLDRMLELLVRDFAGFALHMALSHRCSPEQEQRYRAMLSKPVLDAASSQRLWTDRVLPATPTSTVPELSK